VSDTSTAGVIISNLAALRAYTGPLDQAIALMQEALAYAAAVGDSATMVYARNSLAEPPQGRRSRPGPDSADGVARQRGRPDSDGLPVDRVRQPGADRDDGRAGRCGEATLERASPMAVAGGCGRGCCSSDTGPGAGGGAGLRAPALRAARLDPFRALGEE
jgi:hypothetical protein